MQRKRTRPALLAIEPVATYRPFLQVFSEQENIPIIYASSFAEGIAAIDRGWYRLAVTELTTAPMGENPGDLGTFVRDVRLAHDEHLPIIGWTNMPHRTAAGLTRKHSLDALLRKGPPMHNSDTQQLYKLMGQLLEHPTDYRTIPYLKPYRAGGTPAFWKLE